MSNMLFCVYILFIMHICILFYIHVTVTIIQDYFMGFSEESKIEHGC